MERRSLRRRTTHRRTAVTSPAHYPPSNGGYFTSALPTLERRSLHQRTTRRRMAVTSPAHYPPSNGGHFTGALPTVEWRLLQLANCSSVAGPADGMDRHRANTGGFRVRPVSIHPVCRPFNLRPVSAQRSNRRSFTRASIYRLDRTQRRQDASPCDVHR
jgi:hypothetical protein